MEPSIIDGSTRNQGSILNKIQPYLREKGRSENFIEQFREGYCSGISALWSYAKWLQTQLKTSDKPRDDYDWFKNTIDLILKWEKPDEDLSKLLGDLTEKHKESKKPYKDLMDELGELEKNQPETAKNLRKLIDDNEQIERFISYIEYFQHIYQYLPISQGSLEKSLVDSIGRTLKKEYSIAALFTLDQLKLLLKTENIIQADKLISIYSHNHATALFKHNGVYYYFDPNALHGEQKVASTDDVASLIFNANDFKPDNPSPLGLKMFTFGEISQKYPAQSTVLKDIGAISNQRIADYADRYTGLMIAAKIGCAKSAEALLRFGSEHNLKSEIGWTALMLAARYDHFDALKVLLNDPNIDPNLQDSIGLSALMLVAFMGYPDIVEELLKKINIEIDLQDQQGMNALMYAARSGKHEIFNLLLMKNANIFMRDKNNRTILMHAVKGGNPKIVGLLLTKGAYPKAQNIMGKTVLMYAAESGNLETIKLILDTEVDRNIKEKTSGSTVLHLATKMRNVGVLRLLLSSGADPSIKNNSGLTPLLLATEQGYKDIIEVFIDNETGGNFKSRDQDDYGMTALMCASKFGRLDIVELFFNKGADPNEPDKDGVTAFIYAAENGHADVIKFFLEKKYHGKAEVKYTEEDKKFLNLANLNTKDALGNTVLIYAATNGRLEDVRAILKGGANPNITNIAGKTALALAIKNKHFNIVEELLKNGADINIELVSKLTKLNDLFVNAVKSNYIATVKALLGSEKISTKNILTMFKSAIEDNNVEVAITLLPQVKAANFDEKTIADIKELEARLNKGTNNEKNVGAAMPSSSNEEEPSKPGAGVL